MDVIKKEDGLWAYYFIARIGNVFARIGTREKFLTPNLYTTISFLLIMAACVLFAGFRDYWYMIIGAVLINLGLAFDCADGQLARLSNQKSKFGHWYDYHSDKIKDGMILIALTVAAYYQTEWLWLFFIAFGTIFFQFLRNITRLNRVIFQLETKGEVQDKKVVKDEKVKSQFMRSFRHSLLFKEADRYFLFTVAIIVNQIALGLIIYFALEIFYAAVSAVISYKEYAKYDRQQASQ